MKPRSLLAAAVLLLATVVAPAPAAPADEAPDVLIRTTTEQVLELIRSTPDHRRLAKLLEPLVMPHFDFARMTRLAVGRAWSQASAVQRRQLEEEFTTLLVRTYANGLVTVAGKRFRLAAKPAAAVPAGDETTVHTRILVDGREPLTVDYEMEKTAAGWQVFDVVVGGISLVMTCRSAFVAEIGKSGIDGLIKALGDKNRALPAVGPASPP